MPAASPASAEVRRLRIVFFGTPSFATPSLEALIRSQHEVVAVVSQPDRPKGRGQEVQATPTRQVAEARGIRVIQPLKMKDEAFMQSVRELNSDLGIVVAFGRILSDALLAIPRLGMINVHASILPRYRGAAPIQRAVLAGDAETGVTIMRVATELDAGPTFAVGTVPIPPDATSGDMEAVLAPLGAALLLPVVDDLAAGRAVERPQDHTRATHAAKIVKGDGVIDWRQPADIIHNKVRGLQPWPLASTHLAGSRVVVRRTVPDPGGVTALHATARTSGGTTTDSATPLQQGHAPGSGTIVRGRGDELVVACGDKTALRILELQPEGRRTMTAREFLAGRGGVEGARFGA